MYTPPVISFVMLCHSCGGPLPSKFTNEYLKDTPSDDRKAVNLRRLLLTTNNDYRASIRNLIHVAGKPNVTSYSVLCNAVEKMRHRHEEWKKTLKKLAKKKNRPIDLLYYDDDWLYVSGQISKAMPYISQYPLGGILYTRIMWFIEVKAVELLVSDTYVKHIDAAFSMLDMHGHNEAEGATNDRSQDS